MTSTEYDPELYHLLHRGNPGDLRWYRQRCAGAQRILELGAAMVGSSCRSHKTAHRSSESMPPRRCWLAVQSASTGRDCAPSWSAAICPPSLCLGALIGLDLVQQPVLFDDALGSARLPSKRSPITSSPAVALLDAYAADPVAAGEAAAESVAEHVVALFHDGDRQVEVRERSEEQPDRSINPPTTITSSVGMGRILQSLVHPAALRVPTSNAAARRSGGACP